MKLSTNIQKQVVAAFRSMGDLVKDAKYRVITGETRGADLKLSRTYKETAIKCIIAAYTQKESGSSGGAINKVTDKKFLIPRYGLSIDISIGGWIVADGVEYSILDTQADPANSLFTVQARMQR